MVWSLELYGVSFAATGTLELGQVVGVAWELRVQQVLTCCSRPCA